MSKEHTPTPWDQLNGVFTHDDGYFSMIQTPDKCIANVFEESDAAHIVKCVNMHDELVGALKSWVDAMDNDRSTSDSYLTALETLKKAGAL